MIGPPENLTSSDVAIAYLHKGINCCYVACEERLGNGEIEHR